MKTPIDFTATDETATKEQVADSVLHETTHTGAQRIRMHVPAMSDQAIADGVIQQLSPKAKDKILAVAKSIGANRKGRRATLAIIRADVRRHLGLERKKAARAEGLNAHFV